MMHFAYKKQKFQQNSVEAVCDVFKGEGGGSFRYRAGIETGPLSKYIGQTQYIEATQNNPLMISEDQLLTNLQEVQKKFTKHKGVPLTQSISKDKINLTIEMETGTGKTYAYINTIYELNKKYGWKKFIIVVPSIAIREGVADSLKEMQDHFKNDYGESITFFVFSSQRKNEINNFERDDGINIMVINAQSFNSKDKNTIHQTDETGVAPIEKIKKTNPIIIIDEPQSVEGSSETNKAREELAKFNALFTLRYSATHRDNNKHNLIYIFDSLDAIDEKIVKKIEIMGVEVEGTTASSSYLFLKEIIIDSKRPPRARIEFEILRKNKVEKITKILDEGTSIFVESNEMEAYVKNNQELKIETIDPINKKVVFNNDLQLKLQDKQGDEQILAKRRKQIRETIKAHLEKELINYPLGIKTLSLFFIDQVEKYRVYDDEGKASEGVYARLFLEEYDKEVKEFTKNFPELKEYLLNIDKNETHQGYFSKDKRSGKLTDPDEKGSEKTSKDEVAFDEIIKNKKDLLNIKKPIRFIFSHSALREGWDNPNVFQICILRDHDSNTIKKKQEVGRGLRLCVDKNLIRVDKDYPHTQAERINILTIIANESFQTFAESLQNNYKEDLRDRPTKFNISFLTQREINNEKISESLANKIWGEFYKKEYVNSEGELTEKFEKDKLENKIKLNEELNSLIPQIIILTETIYNGDIEISQRKEGNVPIKAKLNENYNNKHFQELLNLISHKSMYQVDFDTDDLIRKSIENIDQELKVSTIQLSVGIIKQNKELTNFNNMFLKEDSSSYNSKLDPLDNTVFLLSSIEKIMNNTLLKRNTILKVLCGIKTEVFNYYKLNQEEFILRISCIINKEKAKLISDNVTYIKSDNNEAIDFEKTINIISNKILKTSKKHIYDYLQYDSDKIELPFAEKMMEKDIVKVFARVPTKTVYFYTPVGKFSPDWLVILDDKKVTCFYFIIENKGSMDDLNHRPIEAIKIDCAKKHFSVISDNKVKFKLASNFDDLQKEIDSILC